MPESLTLDRLFEINDRFQRSVNLVSDADAQEALDNYIPTPTAIAVLRRIAAGIVSDNTARAWSVTGPYGAGKSAALLFFSRVLQHPVDRQARELLHHYHPSAVADLEQEISGFQEAGYLIIPMVGTHSPILHTLLDGLIKACRHDGVLERILAPCRQNAEALYERALKSEPISDADVVALVTQMAERVVEDGPNHLGVILLYDELGKSLEYAAMHPEQANVAILQSMAEAAARSKGTPVAFVTVLHQAFEHYASPLSPSRQRDWAKVQGRFEDISFIEREMLHLVDKAIQPKRPLDGLLDTIRGSVRKGLRLGVAPTELAQEQAEDLLTGCAPLHPTTVLLIEQLFRGGLAQNERSLFAFLSSGEPRGMQEHLRNHRWGSGSDSPFYRVDDLYDYVVAALGSGLYTQYHGKKWAYIRDAVDRLPPEAERIDARLIKMIGMMDLFGGEHGVKASREILCYALEDQERVQARDVIASLERLEQWSIVVYRRFKQSYGLWEGSDIDLDQRYQEGRGRIDRSRSLVDLLKGFDQLQPYVAKRHLHETGTFRFFVPWILGLDELEGVSSRSFGQGDGAIAFVVGTAGRSVAEIIEKVSAVSRSLSGARQELVYFALPREIEGIREALEECLTWDWVEQNTPALEGDSVARQELAARQLAAERRLSQLCAQTFGLSQGYASALWIHRGKQREFSSARMLFAALSDSCDRAYSEAPIVKNELLNRRDISSAASAARRQLIERLLTHGAQEDLGMEGYPPEKSAYLSIVKSSGLHHVEDDEWSLGPDPDRDPYRVKPLWQAIERFLDSTEESKHSLDDLYDLLRQPPFGLREGLLPIYAAIAIIQSQDEIALYEDGRFVPQLSPALFDRLIKVPERFELQRYRMDPLRRRILYEYATLFDDGEEVEEKLSPLVAVRPILAFAKQLPRYTELTEALSEEAISVRQALLTAKEPQPLLFEKLPKCVGFDDEIEDEEKVALYFDSLRRVIKELHQAYTELLKRIEVDLLDSLLLPTDLATARQEIQERAGILQQSLLDLDLKAFTTRLADRELADTAWLESIAALLTNKPPRRWNDGDLQRYRVELNEIAGRFCRTEEVALEEDRQKVTNRGTTFRIAVTDLTGRELRALVRVHLDEGNDIGNRAQELRNSLRSVARNRRHEIAILTELVSLALDQGEYDGT